jgi:hypothetical protein
LASRPVLVFGVGRQQLWQSVQAVLNGHQLVCSCSPKGGTVPPRGKERAVLAGRCRVEVQAGGQWRLDALRREPAPSAGAHPRRRVGEAALFNQGLAGELPSFEAPESPSSSPAAVSTRTSRWRWPAAGRLAALARAASLAQTLLTLPYGFVQVVPKDGLNSRMSITLMAESPLKS